MRLTRSLIAKDWHHFGVRAGRVAVEIDDAEQLLAFTGEQFGHVVTGADLVVGIAREVIAERIAGAAQYFQGALRHGSGGRGGGWHWNLLRSVRGCNSLASVEA